MAQQNISLKIHFKTIVLHAKIAWFTVSGFSQSIHRRSCRSSEYHHTLKWKQVMKHDSWINFSFTEVSRWSDYMQIMSSTSERKTVYLPIGWIFCYLLFKHWLHSSSKFSLSWHFLLFYTITTVFVFSQDLVTMSTWSYLFPTLCLAFQWFLLFSQIEMFHLKIQKSQLVHSCSLKEIAS